MTTWMLTGGAGYIGANVLRAMRDAGFDVVVLDDLSAGVRRKVPDGVPLVEASVLDRDAVAAALREHHVTGVIHLAAKKAVGESVANPLKYYRQNVEGVVALLEAMDEVGVRNFVFSSSAAVYGAPKDKIVTEGTKPGPVNPYGSTKLVGEWVTRQLGAVTGMSWISLRYFNVAGAGAPDLGDTGVHNLVPLVLRAVSKGEDPIVFGDDYATPDGTCIRDYIHVTDLAEAHVVAARRVEAGVVDEETGETRPAATVYNVGTGEGHSVKEVIAAIGTAIGRSLSPQIEERRDGDPPRLVASAARIKRDLGWTASRSLDDIATSAWEAWQAFPPEA